MYLPKVFAETDRDRALDLLRARGFGVFVAGDEIAHLPYLVEGDRLRAHAARRNPLLARVERNERITVVAMVADAYVSASWYERPHEQVPTWNYVVVHASGVARPIDREATRLVVRDLAARHEGDAWSLDALDPSFVDELLDQISGFEIEIASLEAKMKVSQNRSPADRERVAAALERRGSDADRLIAATMRKNFTERRR